MIQRSADFDLGRDTTRIKDQRDAKRQHATVDELLLRLYGDDPQKRWEIQLVADEVGMGKTFVALGTAFSVLQAIRSRGGASALDCPASAPVLVIAPSATLLEKWVREVSEFRRRCMPDHDAEAARDWFSPTRLDRLDDLAGILRGRRSHQGVVLTHMNAIAGKLTHLELKRRFTLGALFRLWARQFPIEEQQRLLKGAPDDWGRRVEELTQLSEQEAARLPFGSVEEAVAALRHLTKHDDDAAKAIRELLDLCKEIATPHTRARDEKFTAISDRLSSIYRDACFAGIEAALPLVIVDEAHNWKNGPEQGTNGYRAFARWIGRYCRRALLLTATPFQLRPAEMLELLRVGAALSLCADPTLRKERLARLEHHRTKVIQPVLVHSADQSRAFARAWARVPAKRMPSLRMAWTSAEMSATRATLKELAHREGVVDHVVVERAIDTAVVPLEPELREIVRAGLRLYVRNEDLSQELGAFIIRHRRRVEHRLVHIGEEFGQRSTALLGRTDKHLLHSAPGLDVRGDAELPHYILMRCVSEMKQGKGRTSLGSALTGCYSTLLASAEGKSLRNKMSSGVGRTYLDLLQRMVDEDKDPEHPKVRAVVDAVIAAWRAGEKSLLFCFRTHTAHRLHTILKDRIAKELDERRRAVVGTSDAFQNLRARLTRRDEDLVLLGLDRVLWSLAWAARSEELPLPPFDPNSLDLTDDDLRPIASLALRSGVDLRGETVDRVFLHRAIEHVVARRLLTTTRATGALRALLQDIAQERWVELPYGVDTQAHEDDADQPELVGLDARGVHARFVLQPAMPSDAEVESLAAALSERRERARRTGGASVLDGYAIAPSFWLGGVPSELLAAPSTAQTARTLTTLHAQLFLLTRDKTGFAWTERLLVLQALRRAVVRESVLVRLLPDRVEHEQKGWADALVSALYRRLPGQQETMADRLAAFVEDMQAASGKATDEISMRRSLYEATRLRDMDSVVLIHGGTEMSRRERVFAGFNSPLLPDVLICTTVGQEGIDLHRHCRHVIHYDLAWNPAVVEQRTGRVDRIGSKTFRERAFFNPLEMPASDTPCLSVGVPFLAGTYDERMYEELRVRAQIFEVLTGGDVSVDNLEGNDEGETAEGEESGIGFPMLPSEMIGDLRVRLHVWNDPGAAGTRGNV